MSSLIFFQQHVAKITCIPKSHIEFVEPNVMSAKIEVFTWVPNVCVCDIIIVTFSNQ